MFFEKQRTTPTATPPSHRAGPKCFPTTVLDHSELRSFVRSFDLVSSAPASMRIHAKTDVASASAFASALYRTPLPARSLASRIASSLRLWIVWIAPETTIVGESWIHSWMHFARPRPLVPRAQPLPRSRPKKLSPVRNPFRSVKARTIAALLCIRFDSFRFVSASRSLSVFLVPFL